MGLTAVGSDNVGRAPRRSRRKRPGVGQRIPVDIGRAAAVQGDGGARRHALIRSGMGHRRGILRRNRDRGRGTVQLAVVDHELDQIDARLVHCKGGFDRRQIGQLGRAPVRSGRERPGVGQGILVDIAGAAAVQGDGSARRHGLIGSGISHRRRILRRNGDRVRGTVHQAVVDDQPRHIVASLVNDERRFHCRRFGQCRRAPRRRLERPEKAQRIAVDIAGTATVESHRLIEVWIRDGLVGAGIRPPAACCPDSGW